MKKNKDFLNSSIGGAQSFFCFKFEVLVCIVIICELIVTLPFYKRCLTLIFSVVSSLTTARSALVLLVLIYYTRSFLLSVFERLFAHFQAHFPAAPCRCSPAGAAAGHLVALAICSWITLSGATQLRVSGFLVVAGHKCFPLVASSAPALAE